MAFRLSPHMSKHNSENDFHVDFDSLLVNACTQPWNSSCDMFASQDFVVNRAHNVNNNFSAENELALSGDHSNEALDNSQDFAGSLESAQSLSDEDCDLISQGSVDSDETHSSEAENILKHHYKCQKSENSLSMAVFPKCIGKGKHAEAVSHYVGKAICEKKSEDYIFVKENELPEKCSPNLYENLEDLLLSVGLTDLELAHDYRYHKFFITLMCAQHVKQFCRNMATNMLSSEVAAIDMIEELRQNLFD